VPAPAALSAIAVQRARVITANADLGYRVAGMRGFALAIAKSGAAVGMLEGVKDVVLAGQLQRGATAAEPAETRHA
jgi:hypothetical protein